jgi:hypothetical protein
MMEQMAMMLANQKPRQNNRKGEVVEGLPGSDKSVACVKRDTKNSGGPTGSCAGR